MSILPKYKLEKYQYDINIRKKRQLYGMFGKIFYFGQWIPKKEDPIIIAEMNNKTAEREASFYVELNDHNNIIRTFGYVENNLNLTIFIQERAQHGDLVDVLMLNEFNITQSILIEIFAQIADAMSYVTSKKIVHGNISCQNILVFRLDSSEPKNNLVKITDFGLARWIDQPPVNEDSTIIPIRYCAPEILQNNPHSSYSEKSDVYSMGVLMWEALSNSEIPYSSVAYDEDVIHKKLNNERLPQPQVCDHQLWVLMNECWHKNPQQRPNFHKIKDAVSNMNISEVPHDLITASSHKARIHCYYELDFDVKIKGLLNNDYPSIYEAQWISEEERPIVLIEKNEEPSKYEKLFYITFKNHLHIVHTFGFVGNDRGSIMILQERASHGNLQSLLETDQFQPSARVLVEIFSQIINAMIDIVSQGLVHGDLRCENILVFQMHPSDPKKNLVKLSNFTLAHPNDPSYIDDRRLLVPVRYCALEILRSTGHSNYSELSDVYSMGVLMWQAYSKGKLPYESSTTNSEIRQRKLNGEKLSKPMSCDRQIWSIMEDCWHNYPELRFTFEEMKILFSKINLEPIETYQYELDVNIEQKGPLKCNHGKFYKAEWIPKRKPSVILIIMNEKIAEREAAFYFKLNHHSYIVHTFGFVKNDLQSIMLLQEQALYGNLQALLRSEDFRPITEVLVTIFLQIVDAMIYITSQDIIHGDLRCANVLVFQMNSSRPNENFVKLTNFSFARTKDQSFIHKEQSESFVRYCATEILQNENQSNYTEFSDIYSMGVLMWEACSKGAVPYESFMNDKDVREQKLKNEKLSRPKNCHNQIWTVIENCWLFEQTQRFNFEELKIQLFKLDLK